MAIPSIEVIRERIVATRILREQQNAALLARQGFNPSTKTLTRPQGADEDTKPCA